MPHTFLHLYPALEAACAESLVLTSTERARRNLILAYNAAQQQQGRRAWPTPQVRTLDGYLASLYARAREAKPSLPGVLSPEGEYQLFRETAPAGAEGLIVLARDAWNLAHQWAIPLTSGEFGASENGRVFQSWAERLERRLAMSGAVTKAQLAAIAPDAPEAAISCYAFERLPRAYSNWLEGQAEVRALPPATVSNDEAQRVSFSTRSEELAAVAQWARLTLEQNPEASIGVVVPDLAERQQAVLRHFTAELDPGLDQGTRGLIDIGSGTPLAAQPIWRVARDLLALVWLRLPAERLRSVLDSPYLPALRLPMTQSLGRDLPPELNLRTLARLVTLPAADTLLAGLPEGSGPTGGERWLARFRETLALAGWKGGGAGTVQYQAWQELERSLDALTPWLGERNESARSVLDGIDRYLATVTFAPERPAAPIQILGYLETTGLTFSHLWVTSLDDGRWPGLPSANPFLPSALRRRHNIPRSTPEQETDFARERLAGWRDSARFFRVSYARHAEEAELRPSPLIRQLPEEVPIDLHPERPHPAFLAGQPSLERLRDTHGERLPEGMHRGGTGRLRDQAGCPFKGYAVHRLALAEARKPHGLPDALDRGVLIHEALQRLYEQARSEGQDPAALGERQFGNAADQALSRHYARFPAAFRDRERRRLITILEAWNHLEESRDGVEMTGFELAVEGEFGTLGLRLKIDRLDRIGDALIVIDYKTGRVAHRLTRERLLDPQLPLYALTNPEIQGVLYAEVREDRPKLRGIAALNIDGASLDEPVAGSWSAQRNRWQEQVDELTNEIAEGLAIVDPADVGLCQRCHLQAFCRIGLEAQAPGSSEESEGSEGLEGSET
ncbi:MAG: PD-(D/E)XK nuclease family protein [Pseudomonadota bacterium]